MNAGTIISSIISGVAVVILAWIARGLRRVRDDFHRFMAEHMWLIATTMWTRDKIIVIMQKLEMPIDTPPPTEIGKDARK